MHSTSPEKAVEGVLALKDEARDRTMEECHHQSEDQSREIRHHASSLAIVPVVSIGRSA